MPDDPMQDDPMPDAPATPPPPDDDPEVARALAAWTAQPPPDDFADRVLAARDAGGPPARRRGRRLAAVAGAAALATAAAVAAVLVRAPRSASSGTLIAARRTTASLGHRGVVVAEPSTDLVWRIDDRGAAEVDQRAGDAFYRVEPGGPFVVHTPAGDVRVTGTCFRVEIEAPTTATSNAMNNHTKLLLSGVAGAAVASAVLITVYEGHVIAETRAARTELAAGTRATLTGDGTLVAGAGTGAGASSGGALALADADDAHATREQLLVRTRAQNAQLIQLRARLAQLDRAPSGVQPLADFDVPEPGRTWHDPSPEKLAELAATCSVRFDEPNLEHFAPLAEASEQVSAGDLDAYNAAMTEVQKRWKDQVRNLYIEITGDAAGADSLSTTAMRQEIQDKSPPGENSAILQRVSRERAGLDQPPADLSKASPLERMTRAYVQLGDQSEAALARRIGADRARAIRGNAWGARYVTGSCPK